MFILIFILLEQVAPVQLVENVSVSASECGYGIYGLCLFFPRTKVPLI